MKTKHSPGLKQLRERLKEEPMTNINFRIEKQLLDAFKTFCEKEFDESVGYTDVMRAMIEHLLEEAGYRKK